MAKRYSHAPEGYRCPFSAVAAGLDCPHPGTTQQDVVLRRIVPPPSLGAAGGQTTTTQAVALRGDLWLDRDLNSPA
ncbi:MAG: hypothetical protein ACP5QO_13085 [Clostridia bacterium]